MSGSKSAPPVLEEYVEWVRVLRNNHMQQSMPQELLDEINQSAGPPHAFFPTLKDAVELGYSVCQMAGMVRVSMDTMTSDLFSHLGSPVVTELIKSRSLHDFKPAQVRDLMTCAENCAASVMEHAGRMAPLLEGLDRCVPATDLLHSSLSEMVSVQADETLGTTERFERCGGIRARVVGECQRLFEAPRSELGLPEISQERLLGDLDTVAMIEKLLPEGAPARGTDEFDLCLNQADGLFQMFADIGASRAGELGADVVLEGLAQAIDLADLAARLKRGGITDKDAEEMERTLEDLSSRQSDAARSLEENMTHLIDALSQGRALVKSKVAQSLMVAGDGGEPEPLEMLAGAFSSVATMDMWHTLQQVFILLWTLVLIRTVAKNFERTKAARFTKPAYRYVSRKVSNVQKSVQAKFKEAKRAKDIQEDVREAKDEIAQANTDFRRARLNKHHAIHRRDAPLIPDPDQYIADSAAVKRHEKEEREALRDEARATRDRDRSQGRLSKLSWVSRSLALAVPGYQYVELAMIIGKALLTIGAVVGSIQVIYYIGTNPTGAAQSASGGVQNILSDWITNDTYVHPETMVNSALSNIKLASESPMFELTTFTRHVFKLSSDDMLKLLRGGRLPVEFFSSERVGAANEFIRSYFLQGDYADWLWAVGSGGTRFMASLITVFPGASRVYDFLFSGQVTHQVAFGLGAMTLLATAQMKRMILNTMVKAKKLSPAQAEREARAQFAARQSPVSAWSDRSNLAVREVDLVLRSHFNVGILPDDTYTFAERHFGELAAGAATELVENRARHNAAGLVTLGAISVMAGGVEICINGLRWILSTCAFGAVHYHVFAQPDESGEVMARYQIPENELPSNKMMVYFLIGLQSKFLISVADGTLEMRLLRASNILGTFAQQLLSIYRTVRIFGTIIGTYQDAFDFVSSFEESMADPGERRTIGFRVDRSEAQAKRQPTAPDFESKTTLLQDVREFFRVEQSRDPRWWETHCVVVFGPNRMMRSVALKDTTDDYGLTPLQALQAMKVFESHRIAVTSFVSQASADAIAAVTGKTHWWIPAETSYVPATTNRTPARSREPVILMNIRLYDADEKAGMKPYARNPRLSDGENDSHIRYAEFHWTRLIFNTNAVDIDADPLNQIFDKSTQMSLFFELP
jgi:hypothetical protein